MDGVALLVQLLMNDVSLTGKVPASRIMAGALPQGIGLPAIAITSVSRTDHHPLNKGPLTMVRERAQVSIFGSTYNEQKDVQRSVVQAVTAIQRPQFWAPTPDWYDYLFGPFISNVSVLTDAGGPDFLLEEPGIYAGSQDYRITYNEER